MEVKITNYEPGEQGKNLIIESHYQMDMIVLKIGKTEVRVKASELIRAIKAVS